MQEPDVGLTIPILFFQNKPLMGYRITHMMTLSNGGGKKGEQMPIQVSV
jgi:hypothetical protein